MALFSEPRKRNKTYCTQPAPEWMSNIHNGIPGDEWGDFGHSVFHSVTRLDRPNPTTRYVFMCRFHEQNYAFHRSRMSSFESFI